MDYGSGQAVSNKMFGTKARCPNCRSRLTYKGGETLAQECGITDHVLVCGSCYHVFTFFLVPGILTLDTDVTERYPSAMMKARARSAPDAAGGEGQEQKPEDRTAPKRGWLSGLFGRK